MMLAVGRQTYTWSLLMARVFSHNGDLSLLTWLHRAPKVSILTGQVGGACHFYDLAYEVKLYHFCGT